MKFLKKLENIVIHPYSTIRYWLMVKLKYDGKPLTVSKKLIYSDPISTLYELPLAEESQEEIYDAKLDTFNTIFM